MSAVRGVVGAAVLVSVLLLTAGGPALAASPRGLRDVDFEQKLGAKVPTDLRFTDASGKMVKLDDILGARPAFLVLAYYDCPNLCGTLLRTVGRALSPLSLEVGTYFDVIVISIDPTEGPEAAAKAKGDMIEAYNRPGNEDGWHVLTGDNASIRAVADAIGFRYVYDEDLGQYLHPAGLTLLTADGRVTRYYYGLEYIGRDLRLGVIDASGGRIGGLVDKVLLLCYGYDPATGEYTLLITNILRFAGVGTVLVLAAFIGLQLLRERRRRASASPPARATAEGER